MIPTRKQLAPFVGIGECTEWASAVSRKFPHLKQQWGSYSHSPGDYSTYRDHSWVQDEDGTIIDTTHGQFGPEDVMVAKPGTLEHARYVNLDDMNEDQRHWTYGDAGGAKPNEEGYKRQASAPDFSDGVMVALYPGASVAKKLALPDDVEGAQPPDSMHVTLAYIGKKGEEGVPDQEDWPELNEVVRQVAKRHPPQEAEVTGTAHFMPGDNGTPFVGIVGSHTIHDLHKDLTSHLKGKGIPVSDKFPFNPHLTLAYLGEDQEAPEPLTEPVDLGAFTHMVVSYGEEDTRHEFGKEIPKKESSVRYWECEQCDGEGRTDRCPCVNIYEEAEGDCTTCGGSGKVPSHTCKWCGGSGLLANYVKEGSKLPDSPGKELPKRESASYVDDPYCKKGEAHNPTAVTRQDTGITLPVDLLHGFASIHDPHLLRTRDSGKYQGEDWDKMVDDVKRRGVKEPLTVAVNDSTSQYPFVEVIDGTHRLGWAHEAGQENVPVEVRYMGDAIHKDPFTGFSKDASFTEAPIFTATVNMAERSRILRPSGDYVSFFDKCSCGGDDPKCEVCGGSGLTQGLRHKDSCDTCYGGGRTWTGLCPTCKGVGKKIAGIDSLCPACSGGGCKKCEQSGLVQMRDWMVGEVPICECGDAIGSHYSDNDLCSQCDDCPGFKKSAGFEPGPEEGEVEDKFDPEHLKQDHGIDLSEVEESGMSPEAWHEGLHSEKFDQMSEHYHVPGTIWERHKPDMEYVTHLSETPYYIPYCKCGWKSNIRSDQAAAGAWARHVITIDEKGRLEKAGPPTPERHEPGALVPKRHAAETSERVKAIPNGPMPCPMCDAKVEAEPRPLQECDRCGGTGASNNEGEMGPICHMCDGSGIQNQPICPYCRGTGSFVKDDNLLKDWGTHILPFLEDQVAKTDPKVAHGENEHEWSEYRDDPDGHYEGEATHWGDNDSEGNHYHVYHDEHGNGYDPESSDYFINTDKVSDEGNSSADERLGGGRSHASELAWQKDLRQGFEPDDTKYCGTCDGDGSFDCKSCKTTGFTSICKTCEGKKSTKHKECNGSGSFHCDSCGGTGDLPKAEYQEHFPCKGKGCDGCRNSGLNPTKDCQPCRGSGRVRDPGCNGGYNSCGTCKGEGGKTCKTCEGYGQIDCKSCKGEGSIATNLDDIHHQIWGDQHQNGEYSTIWHYKSYGSNEDMEPCDTGHAKGCMEGYEGWQKDFHKGRPEGTCFSCKGSGLSKAHDPGKLDFGEDRFKQCSNCGGDGKACAECGYKVSEELKKQAGSPLCTCGHASFAHDRGPNMDECECGCSYFRHSGVDDDGKGYEYAYKPCWNCKGSGRAEDGLESGYEDKDTGVCDYCNGAGMYGSMQPKEAQANVPPPKCQACGNRHSEFGYCSAKDDDQDYFSSCVACGEPSDYCQGGGPDSHHERIIKKHYDQGVHDECDEDGCDEAGKWEYDRCMSCKGTGDVGLEPKLPGSPPNTKCNACGGSGLGYYRAQPPPLPPNPFVRNAKQASFQQCQQCDGSGKSVKGYEEGCGSCKGSGMVPPSTGKWECEVCHEPLKDGVALSRGDHDHRFRVPKKAAWLDQVTRPYQDDAIKEQKDDIEPVLPPIYEGVGDPEDWRKVTIHPADVFSSPKTGKTANMYVRKLPGETFHIWREHKGDTTSICGEPLPTEAGREWWVDKPDSDEVCGTCRDMEMEQGLAEGHRERQEMIDESKCRYEESQDTQKVAHG